MVFRRVEQPNEQNRRYGTCAPAPSVSCHVLDRGSVVRKLPGTGRLDNRNKGIAYIRREIMVYRALGDHPSIVPCISLAHGVDHYIDILHYHNGDLESYLAGHQDTISAAQKTKWFGQIIRAMIYLHECQVTDPCFELQAFMVDDNLNLRLSGFGACGYRDHEVLDMYRATHECQEEEASPVHQQLFALGSTLYELSAGHLPHGDAYERVRKECAEMPADEWDDDREIREIEWLLEGDREVEGLYELGYFPDVSGLFGGEIIWKCWKLEYSSAKEVLAAFKALKKTL